MALQWKLYESPRTDCTVYVKRWGYRMRPGDAVTWVCTAWRAIHQPTGITVEVPCDRPMSDQDALTQLFLQLDRYIAWAADNAGETEAVRPMSERQRGSALPSAARPG